MQSPWLRQERSRLSVDTTQICILLGFRVDSIAWDYPHPPQYTHTHITHHLRFVFHSFASVKKAKSQRMHERTTKNSRDRYIYMYNCVFL